MKNFTSVDQTHPIFNLDQIAMATQCHTLEYGFTLYGGVLIVWDDDGPDERVFALIDQEWSHSGIKPLTICYRKGSVTLLWSGKYRAETADKTDGYNPPDGDAWSATHYYLDGHGIKEVNPCSVQLPERDPHWAKAFVPRGPDEFDEGQMSEDPAVLSQDNAHLFLPLVQTLLEGKLLQYSIIDEGQPTLWVDTDTMVLHNPPERYRAKPTALD
jgi:hypothetical protein